MSRLTERGSPPYAGDRVSGAPAGACDKIPATPWAVGPFGGIWVAEDVRLVDGKWQATCDEPRLILTVGMNEGALAEAIVKAVNSCAVTTYGR